MTTSVFSDEQLTAYLDGELAEDWVRDLEAQLATDSALAARVAALDVPLDTLRAAMDVGRISAPPYVAPPVAPPKARPLWPGMAAGIAASFIAGMVVFGTLRPAPEATWIEAIVSYQALYVTETLSDASQPADRTAQVLGDIAGQLGVDA
ncbi:MAG: hypothetical protein AAF813_11265, partial [Pseudomonadota bacterium]